MNVHTSLNEWFEPTILPQRSPDITPLNFFDKTKVFNLQELKDWTTQAFIHLDNRPHYFKHLEEDHKEAWNAAREQGLDKDMLNCTDFE